MLDWEILALGTIPVKTLIITCVIPEHVPAVFIKDPELFPGLKTLWLDPPDPDPEPQPTAASKTVPVPEPVSELATQAVESSGSEGAGGNPQSDLATTTTTETEPIPDTSVQSELEVAPVPQPEHSAIVKEASSDNDKTGGNAAQATLEDICNDRGVVLRRDARWLINSISRPRVPHPV
jgi:hypothetical protein